MTDDYNLEADPEWTAWVERCRTELVPKLDGSAYVMSLVPDGKPDIKFAVELGLSIMMDKPIIAVADIGREVPKRLARVVDEVVYGDIKTEEGREALAAELKDAQTRLFAKFGIV